jgi:NDP-sugar pyrophosphorylase family protein
MTDLIQSLIHANRKVVSFPIVEYWLDLGRTGDYERAKEDVRSGRIS